MNPIVPLTAQAASPAGGGALSFVPLIAMFAIFYFLLLRPQIRRQRKHDDLVKTVAPKDRVVMNCGLHGTVVKVEDNDVILEVGDKVRLKYQRSAISAIRNRDEDGTGS